MIGPAFALHQQMDQAEDGEPDHQPDAGRLGVGNAQGGGQRQARDGADPL